MQNVLSLGSNSYEKPQTRTKTLGVRISQSEYTALEQKAWQSGKSLGDWAREVLLCGSNYDNSRTIQTQIFTEVVAIELVVINALEPLLRGEKLSREQAAEIFREVQAIKTARAQELLVKRTQTREK